MMLNSQDKFNYIFELNSVIIEEIATVISIENDKIYALDMFNNKLIFNINSGKCYNDNNTFGAKRYIDISKLNYKI